MPLLARLLGRRPPEPSPASASACASQKSFKFGKDQVRILLFRECERTDTKLLYDSSTVQKVNLNDGRIGIPQSLDKYYKSRRSEDKNATSKPIPNIVEISHGVGFQCMPPNADVNIISEMIFGSVAMNFKGMSLKVHILNSPQRLMCTKIFNTSSRNRCRTRTISSNHDNAAGNAMHCHNSNGKLNGNIETNHNYLNVQNSLNGQRISTSPETPSSHIDDQTSINWSLNKDDSGLYCDFSSQSSISSHTEYDSFTSTWDEDDGIDQPEDTYYFGCHSPISESNMYNSIKWRFNRHLSTNLGYSTASSHNSNSNGSVRPGSDSLFGSNSGTSTTESLSGNSNGSHGRRRKLGLAILITLTEKTESQMLQFLLEHAILLESALDRLRLSIQKAYYEPHTFVSKMFSATEEVSLWFVDLLTGPRFKTPLWIELAGTQSNNQLADQFLVDFCHLLKVMDTKDSYFFMSTLITNVLTYHLGWVNYVSPFNTTLNSQQKDLDTLNRTHPYNPLWAQLGELYGAIGTPARIARTLIYGKQKTSTPLIEKIVTVLSYFIRCGKVKRCKIDPKILSWECVDLVMENYKSDATITDRSISNIDMPSNADYIEMSTFSSNDILADNKESNVIGKIQHTVLNDQSLKSDAKENILKPKSTLKRTESCTLRLHHNISNCSNLLTSDETSSTSTLLPLLIDEELPLETDDNQKSFFVNSVHSDQILFDNKMVHQSTNFASANISQKSANESTMNPVIGSIKSEGVVFVLGEDEALIGIKNIADNKTESQSSHINIKNESDSILKPLIDEQKMYPHESLNEAGIKSLQPNVCCTHPCQCKHSKAKKHSGVKFEFDKYPQIVTNYMKSKNLELLDRHVIGKPGNLKIDGVELERNSSLFIVQNDNERCVNCSNGQILQTPSNASELEFTSDIPPNHCDVQYAKEELVVPRVVEPVIVQNEPSPVVYVRRKLEKTVVVNVKRNHDSIGNMNNLSMNKNKLKSTNYLMEPLELPFSLISLNEELATEDTGYYSTMFGGVTDHYISDMILQGTVSTNRDWEHQMRRDLVMQSRTAPGGAVCLFADIDEWTVKVLGTGSNSGGMSALIASMLDTLLQMYKAKVPSKNCLLFLETKLRELCLRSKTLAEILLNSDLCDMDYITKMLNLEPNDVPLLLAIASTHTPQVALKYGIS